MKLIILALLLLPNLLFGQKILENVSLEIEIKISENVNSMSKSINRKLKLMVSDKEILQKLIPTNFTLFDSSNKNQRFLKTDSGNFSTFYKNNVPLINLGMINKAEKPTISYINTMDLINGIECKKAIAYFSSLNDSIIIWYDANRQIKNKNLFGNISEIKGLPIYYYGHYYDSIIDKNKKAFLVNINTITDTIFSGLSLVDNKNDFTHINETLFKQKLSFEISKQAKNKTTRKSLKIGDTIQNFIHKDLSFNNIDFSQFKTKVKVINCWFIECKPCVKEIPDLNLLASKFKEQVSFIAMSFDNTKDISNYFKATNTTFDFNHFTNTRSTLDLLGIFSYPTTLILDENNIVKNIITGGGGESINLIKSSIKKYLK